MREDLMRDDETPAHRGCFLVEGAASAPRHRLSRVAGR